MTDYTERQLLDALAALGIALPDDLPGSEDPQLRYNALLLTLLSEVDLAATLRHQSLYDADVSDVLLAPFEDANRDRLEPVRQSAMANLETLVDQTHALARMGGPGSALSDTPGLYDAYAEAALHCTQLARELLRELGPKWPEKTLDANAITHHRDRMNAAVDRVLDENEQEAQRRHRRATADPARRPMLTLAWTQQPIYLLPEAAEDDPAAIRGRLDEETERILTWACVGAEAKVSVIKVRGQFLAVIDAGPTWQCSPAYAERGRGIAAGISAVETITYQSWNRKDPMWTVSGGETDLLRFLPSAAVVPGAYRTD